MQHTAAISPAFFSSFGDLLRYLRRRAHMQQRDLAIAVGYSEGQICRLEQNQRLPDLTTLAARFVPALGLEEEPELLARLLELAAAARAPDALKGAERATAPAAAPIAAAAPPGNLPVPLTPLINRTRESAAVRACLAQPEVRLLTLVGPPGIGKTRLGLHVAATLRPSFADGVFFVALAPIRDAALVLPAIATTLGITPAGMDVIAALRASLGQRQMLLVLDNFEQVAAAASQLAELMWALPNAKALVTSRAALHLSGEHLFVVPPLERADPRALLPLEQLAELPATQLFTSRLRAIRPDFALTQENAQAVAAICDCLDGLPLAIELAAARGRLFSPQALLDRLCGASGPARLEFLIGGPRDLLVHQQTLRSTLDWSYALLDQDERALLRQLSVFVGGCTDAAAEAVCVGQADELDGQEEPQRQPLDPRPPTALLGGLWSLVDKSLVTCTAGADQRARFSMLEIIREYAREKLETQGAAPATCQRHAAYYLGLVEAAACEPSGAQREAAFAQLDADYNNLWAALEWFRANDLAGGLRMAARLRLCWYGRGHLKEGRSWLEMLLAQSGASAPAALRAEALCVASFLAYHQGDLAPAEHMARQSLELYRALGDQHGIADAMCNLAGIAFMRTEYVHAQQLFAQCLELYRELGNRADVALVLKNLGLIAKDQGEYTRAIAFYEESLAIRRELADQRGIAQTFFNLAVVSYWQGDYARTIALAEQGLALYRQLGDSMGAAYTLDTLGMALHRHGDQVRAMLLLEESLGLLRELGDQVGVALLLTDMGMVAQAQSDLVRATELFGAALALAWQVGDKRRVAFCLEGLALALGVAQPHRAAQLFGAAEALRLALGTPLPPSECAEHQRSIDMLRARDPLAFAEACAAGRAMALEQAVGFALEAD